MEKENSIFRQKFQKIKNNLSNLESLINMLLSALDNEFNPPDIDEIYNYIFILKNHVEEQYKLLDEFMKDLKLPDEKAQLTIWQLTNFKNLD